MNENVYWLLELAVQHGRRDEFTLLMREMVGAALGEPETLNYEWHINADGTACHVYVRYRNCAAVMTHMRAFGNRFSDRFLDLARITHMVVYGAPDGEVKIALAPYDPIYFEPLGGFRR
jgi:quinol monooxygenase YgiN